MEELLAYAILLYANIVTEAEYQERLDALFLAYPENRMLLDLECETDIRRAIIYIRTRADYGYISLHPETFGRTLMEVLKGYYAKCPDIRKFGSKMYALWESLPGCLQDQDPFWTFSYADTPLCWNDEAQTRSFYEIALAHYE